MSELRLPELGENIETAEVTAVLVTVGDLIARDQPVIEVETPQCLFTGDYEGMLGKPDSPNYAVAPDGRFLMLRSVELASTADRIAFVRHAIDATGDGPLRAEGSGR